MALSQFLIPFLTAFAVTLIITPIIRRFALRSGMVDIPNPRRINKVPMPTGGGLAIFVGFAVAAFVSDLPHLLPTLGGALIIVLVGTIDDRYGLSPGKKMFGQILGVLVYVIWGSRIEFVSNPFGEMLYLGFLSIPLSIFWMLAVINVMNFIDGLDGLATGIALIAAIALFSLAWDLGRFDAATLSVILIGVTVGFLPFNFNPAKLFLGDSGALLLGFIIAVLSTEGALKGATTIGLSVPVMILAVPVVDMVCAIIRRLQKGVPFYQADQSHFHHCLLKLGLNQRQVVFFAYFLSTVSAGIALLTARHSWIAAIIVPIFSIVVIYASSRVGMIQPLISWPLRRTFHD